MNTKQTKRQVKKILSLEEGAEPKITESQFEAKEKNSENPFGLVQSSEIGFLIALPITLGALFGSWLDNKFHTSPKLMLSFLFIGIFLGFTNLFIIVQKYSPKNKK